MADFPSNKRFIGDLARSSPDLSKKVNEILRHKKLFQITKEFEEDPFQRDEEGNYRFKLYLNHGEDKRKNLLEIFDTFEEINEFIEDQEDDQLWVAREIKTGWGVMEYTGPKIHIFPDSNIGIKKEAREFVEQLDKDVAIEHKYIDIITLERVPGGIKKIFPEKLPEELFRGQNSLEEICNQLNPNQTEDINMLYDVIVDYFTQEYEELFALSRKFPKCSKEELGKYFAETKGKLGDSRYIEAMKKSIENYRSGKPFNHVADRVLTSISYGYNLLSQKDKSVVISNDQDLIPLSNLFYDEIMPRYTAKTIISGMDEAEQKEYYKNATDEDLIEAARKHISWARDDSSINNTAVGIVYVPKFDEFHVQEVANPLKSFFNDVGIYRESKSEMIKEIAISGKTPEEIIESFYPKSTSE